MQNDDLFSKDEYFVLCYEEEHNLFVNFIVYLFYYREISGWFLQRRT
jgi:hypothetical protein